MTTRVYVAGASSELGRAERAMDMIRAMPGKTLAMDWTVDIREHGASVPVGWSPDQKRKQAWICLEAVRTANVVWLLVPGAPSQGCWAEWGAAYAWHKHLVASGVHENSLFSSLTRYCPDTDSEAAKIIRCLF